MSDDADPHFDHLLREWLAARQAEIPNIVDIRECEYRIIDYLLQFIDEELARRARLAREVPRLSVIRNDGPLKYNPRRMSSPLKTDEVREFESQVERVFGIAASATT
ncbi:MAG: hypothetical protein P8X98_15700, partial [Woeseiaceae bacterium]